MGIASRTPNGSGGAGMPEEARNDAIARARSSQAADPRGPSD
jgi:hypothetical protein